jgi:hypothetical protein
MKQYSGLGTCLLGMLCVLAIGCGSAKSGGGGGAAAPAGTGAGAASAGTGGGADAGAFNLACPEYVGPFDGPYASKGACCYRTANSSRLSMQGDSPMATTEYRLNYVQTVNHPLTLGLDVIKNLNIIRVEDEQQSMLWRFQGPAKGGQFVSGDGVLTVGVGRYNCDGTYSYYSDTAAPPRMESSSDPARWAPHQMPITIDVSKDVPDRYKPVWSKNYNRGYTIMPYLNTSTFAMDWELWDQGFALEKMPTDAAALDCVGKRSDKGLWETNGSFLAYVQIDKNDHDPISALAEQTLCQLLSFGVVVKKDDPKNNCKGIRCKPGSADCAWLKLPDSLCPATDDEMSKWACHIGDPSNPDGEKTNCAPDAPTAALDPDKGATSQGQCCDPMGQGKDGLPACNAYMLRNEFVAAAAEITDDRKDTLQTNCTAKKK